ncbi:MAG TPA: formyltransferase family protein, partial [Roseiflexaceae bacterium]
MNLLLVAEESAGIQLLRLLAGTDHRIVAVMASPPKGKAERATMWRAAEKMGLPTWPARLVKDPDFAGKVCYEHVDIILNLHSLFIIHNEVIGAARIGSFNLHPGPLPDYAGLNTVSWAIYRGETTYGVTLHKMAPEVDAGPIVSQSFFRIEAGDNALSVYSKCVKAGLALVLKLLETAAADPRAIPLVPQDLSKRRYFDKKVPEEGRLKWDRPAREIVNFVRACDYYPFPSPWGYPRASRDEQNIAIVKASPTGKACNALPGIVGRSEGAPGVRVACADEWIQLHTIEIE